MFTRTKIKNFRETHPCTGNVYTWFALLVVSLSLSATAFGATDDFVVQTLVGSDTTPPTTPTNLVATAITSSQIDLSWTASTDDIVLGGYQVWRDGAFLATTTAITYADTGLTASTTYVYYVVAFDSFANYSTSSATATATTPSAVVPPPEDDVGPIFGSLIRTFKGEILSLEILPQRDSVIIRYTTNDHLQTVITWGESEAYELGSLAEEVFSIHHETTIGGLSPERTYYISIRGQDRYGKNGELYRGSFETLSIDDILPPSNVSDFVATRDDSDIMLSWTNPPDGDFSHVRIVRNDRFYPSDIADGWVVYEGDAEGARDTGILKDTKKVYYTIFTYDTEGNISSGAVTSFSVDEDGEITTDIDPTKNEISLSFQDIEFRQGGVLLPVENDEVSIDGSRRLSVSLPYERVPEHLKTILVRFTDARDGEKSFSFLLRVNKEKTAYTGELAPLGFSGRFPVRISVFDFKTAQIGYASGTVIAHVKSIHTESPAVGFFGMILRILTTIHGITYLIWFIILLIALTFMGRRLMHAKW